MSLFEKPVILGSIFNYVGGSIEELNTLKEVNSMWNETVICHSHQMWINLMSDDKITIYDVVRENEGELLLGMFNAGLNIDMLKYNVNLLLVWAAKKGHVKILENICSIKEININSVDSSGNTSLIWAVRSEKMECVKLLCSMDNINVNKVNTHGDTPLHYAVRGGDYKIVEILCQHKNININMQNRICATALIIAACNGNDKIIKILLENRNVDVNKVDMNGDTALICAACNGHEECVKLLVDKSDPDTYNKYNYTAIMYAAMQKNKTCVEILTKYL